jgi:predicted ArsR family transcriptional regulator
MASRSAQPATEEEGKAAVTALMQDVGFDPLWDADGQRLWLRTCPFRPVSDHQPAVACSVHLGMMRGTLDARRAPLQVVSLDAAAAPHPCLAVFKAMEAPRSARDVEDSAD